LMAVRVAGINVIEIDFAIALHEAQGSW
jgi:hypothetical protein